MATQERRLYEYCTYQATERLQQLRAGTVFLEERDVLEMFEQFCDAQEEFADGTRNVTLAEFGSWLAAGQFDEAYSDGEPAEILW